MQRKIKFRGKDIATEKWVYGYLYRFKGVYTICENIRYAEEVPVLLDTIGQYTGLKDRNMKEIYEGDIIFIKGETKLLDIKGKVEYSNTFAQFIVTNTGSVVNETEPLGDYEEEDIEKIGNVYDNPELLEKG